MLLNVRIPASIVTLSSSLSSLWRRFRTSGSASASRLRRICSFNFRTICARFCDWLPLSSSALASASAWVFFFFFFFCGFSSAGGDWNPPEFFSVAVLGNGTGS